MNEQQVLANWNRQGWRVTARRPQTQQNSLTGLAEPTGSTIWGITGPNGEYDEVVVREARPARAATPSPGSTDPSQPATGAQYEPVQGPKENPTKPATQTEKPGYRSTSINGVTYETWDGHPWAPAQGLPTETPKPGSTSPDVREIGGSLYQYNPQTQKWDIAIRAPDKAAGEPTTRSVGNRLYQYNAQTGKWTVAIEAPEKPEAPTTKEFGGTLYQWNPQKQTWDVAIAGEAKPTEGATRPNVIQGQQVQQVYRGGEWVVDPSVQPQPFGQQQNVAAEVQRLQSLAQQERNRIQQLPVDDAEKNRLWEQWWNVNIEPRKAELARQQQQTDFDNQLKVRQEQRTEATTQQTADINRFNAGQSAGQDAVANVLKTLPYRVGPGFAENFSAGVNTLSRGGGEVNFSPSDFMFDMPNLDDVASQATSRALASISPYAASRTGGQPMQVPQSFDLNSALSQNRYAPTTTVAPDGTVTVSHSPTAPTAPTAPTDPLTSNLARQQRGPLFG